MHARWSGVKPLLVGVLADAPDERSRAATFEWPALIATISPVEPSRCCRSREMSQSHLRESARARGPWARNVESQHTRARRAPDARPTRARRAPDARHATG
eukprot:1426279-Prymnesium_polylepis.1